MNLDSDQTPTQDVSHADAEGIPYPRIGDAVLLLILLSLVQAGLALMMTVGASAYGWVLNKPAPPLNAFAKSLLHLGSFGWVCWMGAGRARVSLVEIASLRHFAPRLMALFALATVGVLGVSIAVVGTLVMIVPPSGVFKDMLIDADQLRANWWTAAYAILGAPVLEELLFRGVLLRGFLLQYSARKAIFVSALMFALTHMNPYQFFPPLFLGTMLGWWYKETRSLAPCFFGHMLNNSLGVIRILASADQEVTNAWVLLPPAVIGGAMLVPVCLRLRSEFRANA